MKITSSLAGPEINCPNLFARKFVEIAGLDPRLDIDPIASIAATAPLGSSPCHGFRHWLTVLKNGMEISKASPHLQSNAIRQCLMAFALFHDSRRESERHCTEHGKAAAMFMLHGLNQAQQEWVFFRIGQDTRLLAAFACDCHTICDVPDHSTILRVGAPSPILGSLTVSEIAIVGACLDSDRLDLGRVGIMPNSFYLHSNAAKSWAEANKTLAHGF